MASGDLLSLLLAGCTHTVAEKELRRANALLIK